MLCIDRRARHGQGFVWNHIPYGAEDFTGDIPLQERVDLLRHASFFIGLGSGLSWLARAAGIPVVLISGFSLPNSEFHTPGGCSAVMAVTAAGMTRRLILTTVIFCGARITGIPQDSMSARG